MAAAAEESRQARESPKKHWVFTLNNPGPDDQGGMWLFPYEYAVLGMEICPTTGTPHIQGYVIFKTKYRLTQLKKHSPQGQRAHWEPQSQYSTPAQAADYCMKEGNFKQFGQMYDGCEEFIDYCLFEGNHSDEFADEVDDDQVLKRVRSA